MKILFVGGTWSRTQNADGSYGTPSHLVESAVSALKQQHDVLCFNGGYDEVLITLLHNAKDYDIVFWWPNVPNDLPKNRDIKAYAPHVMLVSSKRNDGGRYSFMQMTQRALAVKANLCFEFAKEEERRFCIRVYDPLGCQWYCGYSIQDAMNAAMDRLLVLRSVTRQGSVKSTVGKEYIMNAFFPKEATTRSDRNVPVPEAKEFLGLVREYAEQFHEILNPGVDIKRFLGNASLRPANPPQVGRCSKGFPSFKSGDYIFVSQRNIDKQFINESHLVPCYMENGILYYCGDEKPSVDTPIQMRLYEALPNIRYIIHSHCYLKDAAFTDKPIPCGAVEEVDEVVSAVQRAYSTLNGSFYAINLIGHGSLLMAGSVEELKGAKYYGRTLPEVM